MAKIHQETQGKYSPRRHVRISRGVQLLHCETPWGKSALDFKELGKVGTNCENVDVLDVLG